MKSIINIIVIICFAITLQGQRDTLDYTTAYDSDTITASHTVSDSSWTFRYSLNDVLYLENHVVPIAYNLQDTLDSIMVQINQMIEFQRIFVEQYYQLYQQTNSELWNLQRHYARLEELYDALYNP